jgi:CheY-like chemotaxis protein
MPDPRNSDNDLDFTAHFNDPATPPEPKLSPVDLRQIDDLGVIGTSELKAKGFFARLVNAETRRAPARPADTTVLVVEDDEGTASVILKVLAASGYQTRHAGNRQAIIDAFRRMPLPDIVLLDVMLPKLNGFEVLARIRHHPRLQGVPVIMLTSLGERTDIVRGLSYGADGYITKPALPSTLLEAIKAVSG